MYNYILFKNTFLLVLIVFLHSCSSKEFEPSTVPYTINSQLVITDRSDGINIGDTTIDLFSRILVTRLDGMKEQKIIRAIECFTLRGETGKAIPEYKISIITENLVFSPNLITSTHANYFSSEEAVHSRSSRDKKAHPQWSKSYSLKLVVDGNNIADKCSRDMTGGIFDISYQLNNDVMNVQFDCVHSNGDPVFSFSIVIPKVYFECSEEKITDGNLITFAEGSTTASPSFFDCDDLSAEIEEIKKLFY